MEDLNSTDINDDQNLADKELQTIQKLFGNLSQKSQTNGTIVSEDLKLEKDKQPDQTKQDKDKARLRYFFKISKLYIAPIIQMMVNYLNQFICFFFIKLVLVKKFQSLDNPEEIVSIK